MRAARFFSLEANGSDRKRIRVALKRETIFWIKHALERAERVARDRPDTNINVEYADPPESLVADLKAQAIKEVSGTLIHEVSTKIGSLSLEVSREVPAYDTSQSKVIIESLKRVIRGISQLNFSVGRPQFVQTDLVEIIKDVKVEFGEIADIRLAGKEPFLVLVDESLIALALNNVVKNCTEAMMHLPLIERHITINWGHSKPETWVTVIDNGPGFERDPSTLISLGESTKQGNMGYGLEVINQSMHTLEGTMILGNSAGDGARVELRWLDNNEDTIS